MKINTKIKCKNQKDFEKQSIKTLLIKSIKTYKININRNIDKFIDQNQYPMLRERTCNPESSTEKHVRFFSFHFPFGVVLLHVPAMLS